MKVKRMLFIILALSLTLVASPAQAQSDNEEFEPVAEEWRVGFESITAADAVNYVEFFASDELEGRDTASRGLRIARNYAASLFALWGIAPAGDSVNGERTYHQTIPVIITEPGPDYYLEVRNGQVTSRFQADVDISFGWRARDAGTIEAPVVFAGYGISAPELNYDDFAGIDVRGKIVLVLTGIPGAERDDSPFAQPVYRELVSPQRRYRDLGTKLTEMGAVAVVTVNPYGVAGDSHDFHPRVPPRYLRDGDINPPGRRISVPSLSPRSRSVPSFSASQRVADALLTAHGTSLTDLKEAIDSTLQPHSIDLEGVSVRINIDVEQTADVAGNVLGIIEGSDPELKDEVIVIGAHLDHLGMTDEGYVFNGADDNASGSAGVLELAQAFALNPIGPRRTILFALWTGEEKGLFGSRYFVEYPTVPRENIVAYLNLDMLSRDWSLEAIERMAERFGAAAAGIEITPELALRLITVQLSEQAPDLNRIIMEENDAHIGLFVFPRPTNTPSSSDHVPFHNKDIPAAFFFSAMHDDLHRPSDTVERINGGKMERIIRLVYLVASELAQMPERLPWVEGEDESN